MQSPTSPVTPGGDTSTEKESAWTNQARGTETNGPNGPYMAYNPASHAQHHNPSTGSHGQGPTFSEIGSNPLPQVIFGDAVPEVVKPEPGIVPDAVREDFVNDPIPGNAANQEPKNVSPERRPWYKKRSVTVLAISAVAIVAILAVLFGTLGGLGVFRNNRSMSPATTADPTSASSLGSTTSTTGPPASASTTASSATTSSSSSGKASPSVFATPQCYDNENYWHNVSFVSGNVAMHGVGYKLPAASDQEACCIICYTQTALGCNLWVWDPKDHPTVPCTIIMGYVGPGVDTGCPYGHTNASDFSIQVTGNGVMGSGPCGNGGTAVTTPA